MSKLLVVRKDEKAVGESLQIGNFQRIYMRKDKTDCHMFFDSHKVLSANIEELNSMIDLFGKVISFIASNNPSNLLAAIHTESLTFHKLTEL